MTVSSIVVLVMSVATMAAAQTCPLFKCMATSNCFVAPCSVAKCEAFPNAKCCPTCECNTIFLHANGTTAQCTPPATAAPRPVCPAVRCANTTACTDAPCSATNRACPLRPNIEADGGLCCRSCSCDPFWVDRNSDIVTCRKPEPEPSPSPSGCPLSLICPAVLCQTDRPTCATAKCPAFANATCCSGCCGAPSFRVDGALVDCDICKLPAVAGPCRAAIPKFFFDSASATCKSFTYGGCGGNANLFNTEADCLASCGARTTRAPFTCGTCPADDVVKASCERQYGTNGYSIVKRQCCNECVKKDDGAVTSSSAKPDETKEPVNPCLTVRCKSPEVVESECKSLHGEGQYTVNRGPCCATCVPKNPCKLPILLGTGKAAFPSFGFDAEKKACVAFTFGGGDTNANRFDSIEKCSAACLGGSGVATTGDAATKSNAIIDDDSGIASVAACALAAVGMAVAAQL